MKKCHTKNTNEFFRGQEYGELSKMESFIESGSEKEEEARGRNEEVKKQNMQKKKQGGIRRIGEVNQKNNLKMT